MERKRAVEEEDGVVLERNSIGKSGLGDRERRWVSNCGMDGGVRVDWGGERRIIQKGT